MSLNRFIDDISTRSIEFNLGFVNKVFLNNTDKQEDWIDYDFLYRWRRYETLYEK